MTDLTAEVVEAFAKDEIGVGHALLLARLQPERQLEALNACYQEQYGNGSKAISMTNKGISQIKAKPSRFALCESIAV